MMRLDENLPHEIILDILKRLPVKPLMRFKCVSKSWRCMIDDPDFVAMHLKHSALSGMNWYVLIMVWYISGDQMNYLFPEKSLTAASQLKVEIPFISRIAPYSVAGSCNGLVCLAGTNAEDGSHTIFLWNLFTRKYKAIQSSPLDSVDTREVLSFGYSDKIKDYKVVRTNYFHDKYKGYLGRPKSEVEVYSLRTNMWQKFEFDNRCQLGGLSTVSFNENLHWISTVPDEVYCWCYESIITFGLADEAFNEIALPKSCLVGISHGHIYLAILNSSLGLLIEYVDVTGQLNNTCSVWVMKEYGVVESWTKLHTIDLNEGVSRFYGFTRSGELLMDTHRHELISWSSSMGFRRLLWMLGEFNLMTVEESLVSP